MTLADRIEVALGKRPSNVRVEPDNNREIVEFSVWITEYLWSTKWEKFITRRKTFTQYFPYYQMIATFNRTGKKYLCAVSVPPEEFIVYEKTTSKVGLFKKAVCERPMVSFEDLYDAIISRLLILDLPPEGDQVLPYKPLYGIENGQYIHEPLTLTNGVLPEMAIVEQAGNDNKDK